MDFEAFDEWTTQNPTVTELIKWTNYPAPPHFATITVPGDMDLLAEISRLTKDEVKMLQTRCVHFCSVFINTEVDVMMHCTYWLQ